MYLMHNIIANKAKNVTPNKYVYCLHHSIR